MSSLLHTVANHSDDYHYYTAVKRTVVNIIKCKLTTPHTCMKMQVWRCNNANSPGLQAGAFLHSLEYLSEPSSSVKCNVYAADSFLNGIADTIQKEFGAKLSVRPLHLVESALLRAGEGTLWLEVTSTEQAYS